MSIMLSVGRRVINTIEPARGLGTVTREYSYTTPTKREEHWAVVLWDNPEDVAFPSTFCDVEILEVVR